MTKDREDKDLLSAGLTAEGIVFLLIGIALGAIGAALTLAWQNIRDRSA